MSCILRRTGCSTLQHPIRHYIAHVTQPCDLRWNIYHPSRMMSAVFLPQESHESKFQHSTFSAMMQPTASFFTGCSANVLFVETERLYVCRDSFFSLQHLFILLCKSHLPSFTSISPLNCNLGECFCLRLLGSRGIDGIYIAKPNLSPRKKKGGSVSVSEV